MYLVRQPLGHKRAVAVPLGLLLPHGAGMKKAVSFDLRPVHLRLQVCWVMACESFSCPRMQGISGRPALSECDQVVLVYQRVHYAFGLQVCSLLIMAPCSCMFYCGQAANMHCVSCFGCSLLVMRLHVSWCSGLAAELSVCGLLLWVLLFPIALRHSKCYTLVPLTQCQRHILLSLFEWATALNVAVRR